MASDCMLHQTVQLSENVKFLQVILETQQSSINTSGAKMRQCTLLIHLTVLHYLRSLDHQESAILYSLDVTEENTINLNQSSWFCGRIWNRCPPKAIYFCYLWGRLSFTKPHRTPIPSSDKLPRDTNDRPYRRKSTNFSRSSFFFH
jgi:hypothetical protein